MSTYARILETLASRGITGADAETGLDKAFDRLSYPSPSALGLLRKYGIDVWAGMGILNEDVFEQINDALRREHVPAQARELFYETVFGQDAMRIAIAAGAGPPAKPN